MFNRIAKYVRKRRARVYGRRQLAGSEALPVSSPPLLEEPVSSTNANDTNERTSTAAINTQNVPSACEEPILDALSLGTLWNTFAWINRLPVEVLVIIFLSVRLRSWRDWDLPDVNPIHYMRVCRHWYTVIIDHACLWNPIVVGKRTEGLQLALSRSHQMHLHLTFDDLPTLAHILPCIIPLRDRTRSLVLASGSRNEIMALSPLIAAVFPALTVLDIHDHGIIPWASPQSDNFVFRPGNYPRLTHLKLGNIHLELTGRLFRQLTKVTLDSCHIRPSRISADAFLDMLQCGQRLEELVLKNFMSEACSDPPSRHRHAAYLPRLRMLELVDDVRWIRHFTTFVQLPTRGQVELYGTVRDGDVDTTGPLDPWALLVPHRLSDMRFARHADRLIFLATTSAGSYSLTYLSVSPALTLTLHLPDRAEVPSGSAVLATIRAHWQFQSPSALRMLTLRMDLRTAARADFELLFDAFPHLRLLRVASPNGDSVAVPSGLLDALASAPAVPQNTDAGGVPPCGDPDASRQPSKVQARCAKLRNLALEDYTWDDGAIMAAVLDCLRARARLGARKLADLEVVVRPRASGLRAAWLDRRYAALLEDLVSHRYRFTVSEY